MHVFQIGKSLPRRNNGIMNVQIAIRLLRGSNHFDQILDCGIDRWIVILFQEIARSFDPFADVRIPEQVVWYWPDIGSVVVAWVPSEFESIVSPSRLENIQLIQ